MGKKLLKSLIVLTAMLFEQKLLSSNPVDNIKGINDDEVIATTSTASSSNIQKTRHIKKKSPKLLRKIKRNESAIFNKNLNTVDNTYKELAENLAGVEKIDGSFKKFTVASYDKQLSFLMFVPSEIHFNTLPTTIAEIEKIKDPAKRTLAYAKLKSFEALDYSKETINNGDNNHYLRYLNSVLEIAWAKLLYKPTYKDSAGTFGVAVDEESFITDHSAKFASDNNLLQADRIIDADTALGNLLFLAQNDYLPAILYYGILKFGKKKLPIIDKDLNDGLSDSRKQEITETVQEIDHSLLFDKTKDRIYDIRHFSASITEALKTQTNSDEAEKQKLTATTSNKSPLTKRKTLRLSRAKSTIFAKTLLPPRAKRNGNLSSAQSKSPKTPRKTFGFKRAKSTLFNKRAESSVIDDSSESSVSSTSTSSSGSDS